MDLNLLFDRRLTHSNGSRGLERELSASFWNFLTNIVIGVERTLQVEVK
jgi:hypothetical protein